MAKKTANPRKKIPNPRLPEIIETLQAEYPDAHCELNYRSAFQLLIATILSAQCTDVRVNIVTGDLFKKYRKPQDYLDVSLEVLEGDIRSTGFYRNKARNIRKACETIISQHKGKVPRTMAELRELGGVGRKTANVVLGNMWNTPDGVVVDTHVSRISQKLGLTEGGSAEKIERDLNAIIPQQQWTILPHWLIFHGRRVCTARNPKCDTCPLYNFCYERA
jgi:endonuclease-3